MKPYHLQLIKNIGPHLIQSNNIDPIRNYYALLAQVGFETDPPLVTHGLTTDNHQYFGLALPHTISLHPPLITHG